MNLFSHLKFAEKKDNRKTVAVNLGNYYVKGLISDGEEIVDYFICKRKDINSFLGKIWKEKNLSAAAVKISLKDRSTLVRCFPFPKVDRKKMKAALSFELNKHIPFSPDKVYFDFSVIQDPGAPEVTVILAAAGKEIVDKTIAFFKEEKIELDEITLDSVCLANFFLSRCDKEINSLNIGVLDIGYTFSNLIILHKGKPFLTRDLRLGTKDFLQVAAFSSGQALDDVENLAETIQTA